MTTLQHAVNGFVVGYTAAMVWRLWKEARRDIKLHREWKRREAEMEHLLSLDPSWYSRYLEWKAPNKRPEIYGLRILAWMPEWSAPP